MKAKAAGKDKKKKKSLAQKESSKTSSTSQSTSSVNEIVLQSTVDSMRRSLEEYKDRLTELIFQNKELQEISKMQEQDSLEVIKSLQIECDAKEKKIRAQEKKMEDMKAQFEFEKTRIVKSMDQKVNDLNGQIHEKEVAFSALQSEIVQMKDFKKKKYEMIQEIEKQRQELQNTEDRHKEIIAGMEKKFIQEKIRLQQNADSKISMLALTAHSTAVTNINDTTKEIFKENIKMVEALRYHIEESEMLSKHNLELLAENKHLKEEKEINDVILRDKIVENKNLTAKVQSLTIKIEEVESCLSATVMKYEDEKKQLVRLARENLGQVVEYANKLRDQINKKSRESEHVRKLAQHVLDQRTEIERFFIEALEQVKNEMAQEMEDKKRQALNEYNNKLRMALSQKGLALGTIDPYLVRRGPSLFAKTSDKITVGDLGWSDKERILRILFAKMNGVQVRPKTQTQLPPLNQPVL